MASSRPCVDAADVERDGGFADGLVGFGVLWQGDQHAVGRRMPAFSRAISVMVWPSYSGVVERDVGDDGEQRLDDVGGVQASAQADFEDGDVDLRARRNEEGHRGEGLEEAGRCGQLAPDDQALGRRRRRLK